MPKTEGCENEKPPPRRSFSPVIDEMAARKSIRQMMTAEFRDFDSTEPKPTSEVKLATAREKCIELAGRERILSKKYKSTRLELKDAHAKMDTANKKLCDAEKRIVGLENLLKARESISYFEKLYFPIWLSQLECSRQLKWIICFKFNLSVYARVLQSRISTNPLSPDDMAKTIVKVYGEASEVCHLDVKGDIVFTDQHWEELFLKFNLQMEDERRFIRSLFSPVTSADKRKHRYNLRSNSTDYVFDIEFIKSKTLDRTIIKQMLGDNGRFMEEVVFERNRKQELTNRVFIFLKHISFNKLNVINEILKREDSVTNFIAKEA